MTNEQKIQNLFLATNWSKILIDYKRGILADDDEYRSHKVEKDEH